MRNKLRSNLCRKVLLMLLFWEEFPSTLYTKKWWEYSDVCESYPSNFGNIDATQSVAKLIFCPTLLHIFFPQENRCRSLPIHVRKKWNSDWTYRGETIIGKVFASSTFLIFIFGKFLLRLCSIWFFLTIAKGRVSSVRLRKKRYRLYLKLRPVLNEAKHFNYLSGGENRQLRISSRLWRRI